MEQIEKKKKSKTKQEFRKDVKIQIKKIGLKITIKNKKTNIFIKIMIDNYLK